MNLQTAVGETPEAGNAAGEALAAETLLALTGAALGAAETLLAAAKSHVAGRVRSGERVSGRALDAAQFAGHGLAWAATYVESLRQMRAWAERLAAEDRFGEMERLILQIAYGEYLAQLAGGIPMSQAEIARPQDMGLGAAEIAAFRTEETERLIAAGTDDAVRQRLVALMRAQSGAASFGDTGLDEELDMVRDQFRRFADERVVPHAHGWHLRDELIPMEILEEMSALGVFGLTIPEEHGGFGMGKTAMCVVSEELSRGYIGVGSLGTRTEIAAELILGGGTEAQKAHWLPKLASGEILPTAVFTEPNTGSDLGALRTRAARDGDDWVLTGNKTWITHAARTDLMTVLARTDPETSDYRGLSMFLAEKTRGTDDDPFPDATIAGGEIEVLGYRGMKEYTLALDGHRVPAAALLGGEAGQGFKQLMRTFESARIQTAARAIGVAQAALEAGLAYAEERSAFGRPIVAFPRVGAKLAMAAVEIMVARQLTYHSAREKDADRRCDLEAGMAKLLGARVAWSTADCGLQIHGGNGFALEYPISRLLCDARILNIFEGAAEIQAQVIARRLLEAT
ncbi:acyl-CoA dehydrogenase family protein [Paralimibaculum aggregatum]|uniref:Acyl-CoA dehydrogenase family protein n=1 Tax=Paralimibaculum aggregatum TaxID=3036245 RepID=A0ABQ6LRL7_9RHOB|nr:acyl-CoA dehydrogenase family protein [Limibaculum sp. NKW23]GMG84808.1 acyl-CoA dehydrogenase family protein [Limibaculum sp. NKW23]